MPKISKISFFLLCLFFIGLFCWLGIWQLHRYQEKKTLLHVYQQGQIASPLSLSQITDKPQSFQPVSLVGRYLNGLTMFVQNQFYQGRVGFDVLTPVKIPGQKKLLLVDRGWVPEHTKIEAVGGEQQITGHIKLLNEYRFTLGKNILMPKLRPIVMQKIEVAEIAQLTHQDYYPFVLRLNASEAHGFIRDWTVINILPERHMAYAIQWFVMAFVLLCACFCFFCRSRASLTIAALVILFLLPIVASGILYYSHFPLKTTNHGKLVTPPLDAKFLYPKISQSKVWRVIYLTESVCHVGCQNTLHQLRQVQKALGKDDGRVSILLVSAVSLPHKTTLAMDQIYLVDPIGNLFMYYPGNTDPMNVLKDLKKVLEVSQIG